MPPPVGGAGGREVLCSGLSKDEGRPLVRGVPEFCCSCMDSLEAGRNILLVEEKGWEEEGGGSGGLGICNDEGLLSMGLEDGGGGIFAGSQLLISIASNPCSWSFFTVARSSFVKKRPPGPRMRRHA